MKNAREVVVTSDSSGEPYSAAVWDPLTGSLLTTYRNATALGQHTLSLVGDSYILGADVTKGRLYLWPLNSPTPVANLRLKAPGKVSALSCTPDGSYAVVAVHEKIFLWQLTTGRLLNTVGGHYQTITCLEFCQDGASFASGGEDGVVLVWSLTRLASDHEQVSPTHLFADHSLPIKDLHYGSFGAQARLISVSLDRTARIYDCNAGLLLLTLIFDFPLTAVCTDVREANLFVGSSNGLIMQFDLRDPPRATDHYVSSTSSEKSGNAVFKAHTGSVTALSVSTGCSVLLSGSSDGSVHIWDIPSRQVVRTITHKGAVTSARFTPAFHNYRAQTLVPSLQVRPLQMVSDESGKDDIIEIISQRSDSELLDFDSYSEKNVECGEKDVDSARKLVEARAEIDSLKMKNADMYKYAVKLLTSKSTPKKNK